MRHSIRRSAGVPAFRSAASRCSPIAFDGADHRTELDQHAIAGGFDYTPAMLGDQRIGGAAVLS
jgi:hypothetical protein